MWEPEALPENLQQGKGDFTFALLPSGLQFSLFIKNCKIHVFHDGILPNFSSFSPAFGFPAAFPQRPPSFPHNDNGTDDF
jgi:hypothetical protein